MNNTSFLGLYIILSLLAALASVALALLKILKVITSPWLFVLMPACAILIFVIAIFAIAFGIQEIKERCNANKYITKNIYE